MVDASPYGAGHPGLYLHHTMARAAAGLHWVYPCGLIAGVEGSPCSALGLELYAAPGPVTGLLSTCTGGPIALQHPHAICSTM